MKNSMDTYLLSKEHSPLHIKYYVPLAASSKAPLAVISATSKILTRSLYAAYGPCKRGSEAALRRVVPRREYPFERRSCPRTLAM
jgi:hypothetical protein